MNVSKEDCWKNTSWGYKWKRDYPLPFWSLKDWGKERGSKLSEFRLGIFHLKRLAVHWYVYNFSNYVRIINYRGFHAYECFCGYWHIYAISVLANRGQKRGIIVGKRTDWGALHWGKSGNNISFSHKGRERAPYSWSCEKEQSGRPRKRGHPTLYITIISKRNGDLQAAWDRSPSHKYITVKQARGMVTIYHVVLVKISFYSHYHLYARMRGYASKPILDLIKQ